MIRLRQFAARMLSDCTGTTVIEVAIVAPVLVLMSLGSYQISGVVARQTELESAAAEGSAIALASAPDNSAKRTTLQNVITTSIGTSNGSTNVAQATVTEVYRCNSATTFVTALSSCTSGVTAKYVKIVVTDTYTPAWTRFGVGSAINFNVTRYVMYKQQSAT